MKRIYVAGSYSSDNVMGVFNNMRKGMRLSTEVFLAGFAPFCPWIDHHFALMLRGEEKLTVPDFYAYSMAWLEASDAILLVEGWENSFGTKAEIIRAKELGLPIFYELEKVIEFFKEGVK